MAASTNGSKDTKQKLQYTYRANITLGETTLDGLAFLSLTEVYDFMGNMYPLKVLMIAMNLLDLKSTQFLNLKNREVAVTLSLYRVETSVLPTTDPEYTRTEYEIYTNKQFIGTIDEEFIPLTDAEISSIEKTEEAPREDLMHMVRIHLHEPVLNPFVEDYFNIVTDSDTALPDMIAAAFTKCAHADLKLHMAIPDSTATIPENTLIEPMGFLQFVEFLQQRYGLYYYNYNIFIQDYVCYIISKIGVPNKQEHDYILSSIPMTAANGVNVGYNANATDNIIVVESSKVSITDAHDNYYTNVHSKIDEDGVVYHPSNIKKNVALFIENDNLVQSTYDNTNSTKKLRDINVVCLNTYIDVTPDMMFQLETLDVIFPKLAVWGYHRVVSPAGSVVNLNLYSRT